MTPSRTSPFRRWAATLLLLAVASPAAAQWSLGPYSSIARPSSGPLKVSGSVRSYAFVSAVGGVGFSAVAEPGPALAGRGLTLRYDRSRPDGSRLVLEVGGESVRVELPDWQLVPIARYADSEYDACISLFGDHGTDDVYDVVYHPAFENQLLGVRLFQADILLMDLDETWRLPSFGGKVLLGAGETAPERPSPEVHNRIIRALSAAEFRSWVFTDDGQPMRADVVDGALRLTGDPYYYFWQADLTAVDGMVRRADGMEGERKVERHNLLVGRYNALVQAGGGDAAELRSLAAEIERLSVEIDAYNELVERINGYEPEVEPVAATGELRRIGETLRSFNPAVIEAANRTARFAAFFRWVKREHPAAWRKLLDQLVAVATEPQVTTPTGWPRAVPAAR